MTAPIYANCDILMDFFSPISFLGVSSHPNKNLSNGMYIFSFKIIKDALV